MSDVCTFRLLKPFAAQVGSLCPQGPAYSTAVNSACIRLIHLQGTSAQGYLGSGRMACIIKIG